MNRDFKGVWIPKDVWLDKELGWVEKLFFVEIDSLDNEQGCFASNNYFSKFFGITPQRASQIINSLISKGKVTSHIESENSRVIRRTLYIAPQFRSGYQENLIGYQENVEDNNTINNKQILEEKKMSYELKTLFFLRYRMKAKEIKGTDLNEDGKEISPPWGGKEGKLFSDDVKTHGVKTLRKYIELFFSDKVEEVAKFCRYNEKAGYGYSVFHGMIGKLALSKAKINICNQCGKDGSHHPWCPEYAKIKTVKAQEIVEILAEREEIEDLDLVGSMMSAIRSKKKNGEAESE